MQTSIGVFAGLLLACPLSVAAEEPGDAAQQCAAVTNEAARLACFDALFDSPAEQPAPANPTAAAQESAQQAIQEETQEQMDAAAAPDAPPTVESIAIITTDAVTQPARQPIAEETATANGSGASGAPKTSDTKLFGWREPIDFASTIKAVRTRDKQRMLFQLENDEVWMQSTPRNLPIKVGDEVTIKSTLVGGYMLRNADGVGTRVKRIK
ncbi:MAG: type VI secretion system-associated protein TagO [Pseudomonadota bacterium]